MKYQQSVVSASSMSDAGKGKIRHVGGMCKAKVSQHYKSKQSGQQYYKSSKRI